MGYLNIYQSLTQNTCIHLTSFTLLILKTSNYIALLFWKKKMHNTYIQNKYTHIYSYLQFIIKVLTSNKIHCSSVQIRDMKIHASFFASISLWQKNPVPQSLCGYKYSCKHANTIHKFMFHWIHPVLEIDFVSHFIPPLLLIQILQTIVLANKANISIQVDKKKTCILPFKEVIS